MRVIILRFELSVFNSSEPIIKVGKPDFVFEDQFDEDDSESFKAMCYLEYKVGALAKSFKALGCHVSVLRKEVSHLNLG